MAARLTCVLASRYSLSTPVDTCFGRKKTAADRNGPESFRRRAVVSSQRAPPIMPHLAIVILLATPVFAEPVVESRLGRIFGTVRSIEGVNVESFLGIPYAKAPEGDLRFALPEPFRPVGDFEAKEYGPSCAQPVIEPDQKPIADASQEDCLYLNVFRRGGTARGDNKAVFAVLHGGAFSMGSASDPKINTAPLAGIGDVITVSLNYRLGIFGFADVKGLIPGNLGLYDQRLALQWIQDNIRAFGGDPHQVTLFGFSAGSQSISAQIITPLNYGQGLFHSVVMDAGVIGVGIEAATKSNLVLIKNISAELGCETEGTEMLACLRNASVEDLNRLQFDPENSPIATFPPTIDGVFLPHNVNTEIRESAYTFSRVRMIIGDSHDEGTVFAKYYQDGRPFPNLTNEDDFLAFLAKFRDSRGYSIDLEDPDVGEKIIDLYYKAYPDRFDGVSRFIADAFYVCPTDNFVSKYSQYNDDVYLYHFTRIIHGTYLGLNTSMLGAFHGGPTLHFTGALLDANVTVDEADREYFLESIRMISSFARNDKPLELFGVRWLKFPEGPQFLRIGEKPVMRDGIPYAGHCVLLECLRRSRRPSECEL